MSDRVQLPVPLPMGWKLLSRVSCPQCDSWMRFMAPHADQGSDFERDMFCDNESCAQYNTVYVTKLQVDGLTITGVV